EKPERRHAFIVQARRPARDGVRWRQRRQAGIQGFFADPRGEHGSRSRQTVRGAERWRAGAAAIDEDVLLAQIRYGAGQVRHELDGAGRAITEIECHTCWW